jgi:hypothetical protein
MSKEIIAELVDLACQIEEQLKFYAEIGVDDIGGAGVKVEVAPAANLEVGGLSSVAEAPGQLDHTTTPVRSEHVVE